MFFFHSYILISIYYLFLQQWIDLARFTGLQAQKSEPPTNQTIEAANPATVGCNTTEEANVDEIENQQSMR
ncbi:hypothetical protein Hanom_Chr07g00676481 [Helianthus anomalus]